MFRLTTKQQQQQQISHCGYCVVHILHHLPFVFFPFHSVHRLSAERLDGIAKFWLNVVRKRQNKLRKTIANDTVFWKQIFSSYGFPNDLKQKQKQNLLNKHISIFMIHPSRFGYVFNLPWNIFRSKHFYRFVCISHSRFFFRCIFRCHHRLTTALVHFSLDFTVREENQKVIASIEIHSFDINRKLRAAVDWSSWFFVTEIEWKRILIEFFFLFPPGKINENLRDNKQKIEFYFSISPP